jgi:ketosteroid isomerase-like protein
MESHRESEQQNRARILEIFRAIEEREDSKIPELFQADFEIYWPPSLPYGGTFRGLTPRPNGWKEIWDPLQPTEAERKMDAEVVASHGDNVVVRWHQRGVSAKRARFDGEVLGLYTFRGGKLARAQMFYFDTNAVAKFLAEARTDSRHSLRNCG